MHKVQVNNDKISTLILTHSQLTKVDFFSVLTQTKPISAVTFSPVVVCTKLCNFNVFFLEK